MNPPEQLALNKLYKMRDDILKKQAGEIMGSIPHENLGSLFEEPAIQQVLNAQAEVQNFHRELATVLNKYGMDNKLNTPDFILADYIFESLQSLAVLQDKTDRWRNS